MSDTEVDPIWDTTEPFAEQARPESKPRKKKSGTEAEIDLPDSDETFEPVPQEPGELIDGSEDDISAFEEQDPTAPIEVAVDLEDRARVTATPVAQKRSIDMAAEKKTKAEMIRDEIAKRKEKGDSPIRPRDIIAALKEQGVTVTAPQVSVTLRDFDKKPGEKPAKAAKAAPTPKAIKADKEPRRATAKLATPKSTPAANGPSYQALETTAAFVSGCGGLETARQLLDAYARLFNPAG